MRLGVPANIGNSNADSRDDGYAWQGIAAKLFAQLHEKRGDDALMRPGWRDRVDDLPVLVQLPPIGQARLGGQIEPTLRKRFGASG